MAEINITPFTDVCLVLLIIFMISASFMNPQRGLDIKLPAPSSDSKQDTRPVRDIILAVDAKHPDSVTMTVTEGKTPSVSTVFTFTQLLAALEKEANDYHVASVTIKAERGVVYNNVVRLMDTVKQAGIDFMSLAVQAPAASAGEAPSAAGSPVSTTPATTLPTSSVPGA